MLALRSISPVRRFAPTVIQCSLVVTVGTLAGAPAEAQLVVPAQATRLLPGGPDVENLTCGGDLDFEGDTLVAGGPRWLTALGVGEVRTFTRTGGVWTEGQTLLGSVPLPEAGFGSALDLDGDRLVVGAPGYSQGGAGTAFVFERSGATWSETAVLQAPDAMPYATFGTSVAIDGDTLAVGAPGDLGFFGKGAVYVWTHDGSAWTFRQKLEGSDTVSGDILGTTVALEGDVLATGAPAILNNAPGAAYVFTRSGTTWSQAQKLVAPAGASGDAFGEQLALSGAMLAVASPRRDVGPSLDAGAVHVFRSVGGSWTHERELLAPTPVAFGNFGGALDVEGDRLLVGDGKSSFVHAYRRDGGTWNPLFRATGDDTQSDDRFGGGLAFSGDEFAVGATRQDSAAPEAGAVYLFATTVFASEPLCYGDGGDQLGCTDCPCANNAPAGSQTGCLNSTGAGCSLFAQGAPSVASDSLSFQVSGANTSTFALLMSADGTLPKAGPCPPGSGVTAPPIDGLRCVGGNMLRHGTRATTVAGASTSPWSGTINASGFVAGQTRTFQAVYRELATALCGTGHNTSNAVSVTFAP